jgi:hypothetical protein
MSEHTDVGAYSLGLLEPQDRQAFEAHLADCPTCAAELAEFSGMAPLLSGIGPVEPAAPEPSGSAVTDLIRRRVIAQRRRTRWQAVLGAAAGIVMIGGGVAVGFAVAQPAATPVTPGGQVTGHRHSATDPVTGITGTVGLVTKAWGTQVTLDLSKLRGPLECELVAVSKTGQRRVVAGWFVPAAGYGVPGHPGHLLVQGSTALAQKDLSRLTVVVVRGRTLLNIPA